MVGRAYVIMPDHIHLSARRRTKKLRLSSGSFSGSGNSGVDAAQRRFDFNRAVSIIGCGAIKIIIKNGNMSEPTLCEQVC